MVVLGGRENEIGESVGALLDVGKIKDAFSVTAKEARMAIFQNITAWTEQRGIGRELTREGG